MKAIILILLLQGTPGYEWLLLPFGSRASIIAPVALAEDYTSTLYNPACGVGGSPLIEISYCDYWVDIGYGSFVYNGNLPVLVGMQFLQAGTMKSTDYEGNVTEEFHPGFVSPIVTYHRVLSQPSVSTVKHKLDTIGIFGIGVKLPMTFIGSYYSFAGAIDAGFIYFPHAKKEFAVGFAIQNVGYTFVSYTGTREATPLLVRFGVKYEKETYTLAGEFVYPLLLKSYYTIGGEILLAKNLKLRAGYSTMFDDLRIGNEYFLGGGVIGLGYYLTNMHIDYAVRYTGPFGLVHSIGLSYSLK